MPLKPHSARADQNISKGRLTAQVAVFSLWVYILVVLNLYITVRARRRLTWWQYVFGKRKKIVLFITMNYKCNLTLIEKKFATHVLTSELLSKVLNVYNRTALASELITSLSDIYCLLLLVLLARQMECSQKPFLAESHCYDPV